MFISPTNKHPMFLLNANKKPANKAAGFPKFDKILLRLINFNLMHDYFLHSIHQTESL